MEYLSNVPAWVPLECVEAARLWLSEGNHEQEDECRRILSDDRLETFWSKAAKNFAEYWHNENRLGALHLGDLQDFYCELIVQMTLKGGKLPKENLSDKRRRRERIAEKIQRLRHTLHGDEEIARVTLVHLVEYCAAIEGSEEIREAGRAADHVLKQFRHPNNDVINAACMLVMGGPRLPDLLLALEERLLKFQPLSTFDDTELYAEFPQANRKGRQRMWLERRLGDIFLIYTGRINQGLMDSALAVAFDTPEMIDLLKDDRAALDASSIGSRRRSRRFKKPY